MKRLLPLMLLPGLVLSSFAASKEPSVDFTGTWKVNMARSKGAPDWRPETTIVILQGPHQIQFSYFLTPDAAQPFQTNHYYTNGKDQQLYVTASEKAFVNAIWRNDKELNVRTRHMVSNEIADTAWVETDSWSLADGGKTLINKISDGKLIVYEKLDKPKN